MHNQQDSLFINQSGEACIVQCYCGMGHYHGQIEFYLDTDFQDIPVIYVGVAQPPVYGHFRGWFCRFWRLAHLVARITHCWNVMLGRRIEYDFEISASTAQDLSAWLTKAKALEDKLAAQQSIKRGLEQSANGEVHDLGSFQEDEQTNT